MAVFGGEQVLRRQGALGRVRAEGIGCPHDLDRIAELVRLAGDRIVIMAGGGISAENVRRLIAATGVREVHVGFHAAMTYESRMTFRNPEVRIGRVAASSEDTVVRTDAEKVRAIVRSARSSA